MAKRLVRFSINPTPKGPSKEPFAAQLALARVHSHLVAVERTAEGYLPPPDATRVCYELHAKRGLAGYGLARALRILLDVLEGVSALGDTRTADGQPFVHGELVPAMLRVESTGRTQLIPLATWHWSKPRTLPAPERWGHLAPERLLGDAIDQRADVFSAGALLWEALAGRRLFEADSVDSIVMRLLGGKVTLPQLPPQLNWALPLKAVAMCALSVDPKQRFANCAELAEAIAAVAGDRVATHADIADYFGTPDPVTRPSLFARPPNLPTHLSSLSALVAPVQRPEPPELAPADPVDRNAVAPRGRAKRPVWAIAAVSCLLSALGVSAVARYQASPDAQHSAARSAPPLGESLPSASAPLSRVPVAPSSAAPSSAGAVEVPVVPPVPTAAEPAGPASDRQEKPSKLPKSSGKGLGSKLRAPAKGIRSPDRAAAKYGI